MEGADHVSQAAVPEYCMFWIDHWSMCMTKAEWSGWMQAVGSVLAIGIAVAVPIALQRASDTRARRLALDEEARTVSILAAMLERSATSLAEALDRLRVPMDNGRRTALRTFTSKQFDNLTSGMRAVPILHLADGQNAQAWLMISHKLEAVADSFRQGIESIELLEAVHGLTLEAHGILLRYVAELRKHGHG